MSSQNLLPSFAELPKAELHLHLEGSLAPSTVCELAARHGVALVPAEVAARYDYKDFQGFLDAFKWVSSFLRTPQDYALTLERLAQDLLRQNVVYAEVTIALGVMLLRKQDAEANMLAIQEAALRMRSEGRGIRFAWIPDATRQFGGDAAVEVARISARLRSAGVVAFGLGGDELSFPTQEFRGAYDIARNAGLHLVAHAGEVGGPESIREAISLLGAERIGHGIAAMHDPDLMDLLAEDDIALENCPSSNLRTGALAKQLGKNDAALEEHPIRKFFERDLCVTLSTDDPAMFHTDLHHEYSQAASLGFSPLELLALVENSFQAAFLPKEEKRQFLSGLRREAEGLSLLESKR
ncbi:MAG: adenosine deaminase [Candidatus Acidiferrales bacterium]